MVLADGGPARPARIQTTLDADLQRDVEGHHSQSAARPRSPRREQRRRRGVGQPKREWLAWEGSGNYFDGEHGGAINGPLALRQPGSALKPFTYALGVRRRTKSGDSAARCAVVLRPPRNPVSSTVRATTTASIADRCSYPPRSRGFGERSRRRDRIRPRSREGDSLLQERRTLDIRQDRFLLRARRHAGERGSPARRIDHGLRDVSPPRPAV
jgi:hypothetical protein